MNKIKIKYGERTQSILNDKVIISFSNECFVYQDENNGKFFNENGDEYITPKICEMEFIEENTLVPFNMIIGQ